MDDWAIAAYPGWVALSVLPAVRHLKPSIIGRADRRNDTAGVMLDDLWAGVFAGIATILAAGIAHGILMR